MSDGKSSCTGEKHLTRLRSKRTKIVSISAQKERNLSIKKISRILRKDESKRTKDERELLINYSEIVKEAAVRLEKREKLKERLKEVEDIESVIDEKCKQLAEAVSKAEYLVVYTGAGISTSARIPDYRGTSGIWTLLQQGKDIGSHDLTQAEPTFTHMALSQLYLLGKLKHVVSQNCDGLHLRSGLPKRALSEVHGNMYIEVCRSCRPVVEYLRLFDVTEYTARYSHKTMRRCYTCNNPLVDSIVHFGERGSLPWPLNWKGACKAAEKADMILCMGSSLKVLKRYPWLWSMDKPMIRRPHLYIVNLQWTPKDYQAIIKINGKCDNVMKKVMKYLSINVPRYSRKLDPIFMHATPLCKEEEHTTNRPQLSFKEDEIGSTGGEETNDFKALKGSDGCVKSEDCSISVPDIKSEPTEDYVESELIDVQTVGIKIKAEVNGTNFIEHVVTDTGQTEGKCIKEELILITIKSSEELEDCCDFFKFKQSHSRGCVNFIDENLDMPIIMHDDLLTSEKLKLLETEGSNVQNLGSNNTKDSSNKSSCDSDETESDNEVLSKLIVECAKRTREKVGETGSVKKLKREDDQTTSSIGERTNVKSIKNNKCSDLASNKVEICTFCSQEYLSSNCLFYLRMKPIFKDGAPQCMCCDESDAEDSADVKEEDGKSPNSKDADEPPEGRNKELQKVVNPGWYGKGLRKRIRKK